MFMNVRKARIRIYSLQPHAIATVCHYYMFEIYVTLCFNNKKMHETTNVAHMRRVISESMAEEQACLKRDRKKTDKPCHAAMTSPMHSESFVLFRICCRISHPYHLPTAEIRSHICQFSSSSFHCALASMKL